LQALEVISMSRAPLSIIIPTYNALPGLADCLAALVGGLSAGLVREAIVVDGSSTDATIGLATDMGCKIVTVPPEGRGRDKQLQTGAAHATGDWLLFLHGDTVLDESWVKAVSTHMASNSDKAAFFTLAFDHHGSGAKRVAAFANLRARVAGLPYGDQGLLISRRLYDQCGGYCDIPLMEDVDIVRRIGKARLVALNCQATTSSKKFVDGGWWRVPFRNACLLAAFFIGVAPERLAKWYK
jgi:rSAM/selenodomain-associated transferase 2